MAKMQKTSLGIRELYLPRSKGHVYVRRSGAFDTSYAKVGFIAAIVTKTNLSFFQSKRDTCYVHTVFFG